MDYDRRTAALEDFGGRTHNLEHSSTNKTK